MPQTGACKTADRDHLQEELDLLKDILRKHRLDASEMQRVIKRGHNRETKRDEEEKDAIKGMEVISFVKSGHLCTVMSRG